MCVCVCVCVCACIDRNMQANMHTTHALHSAYAHTWPHIITNT